MTMKEKMLSSFPEKKYDGFLEFVEEHDLTGEEVARLFINWHGTKLIDEDFVNEIENEGYALD